MVHHCCSEPDILNIKRLGPFDFHVLRSHAAPVYKIPKASYPLWIFTSDDLYDVEYIHDIRFVDERYWIILGETKMLTT